MDIYRKFDEDKTKGKLKNDGTVDYIFGFIRKFSTASTNKYSISFVLPNAFKSYVNKRDPSLENLLDRIMINCTTVNAPEKTYSSTDITNSAHEERIPYNYELGNISLSFNCFADQKERILFEYWMDFIFNPKNRSYMFLEEYCTDVYIFQLDAKNNPTYGIIAGKAYPISVTSARYDYSMNNSPAKVDVTLIYQYMDTYNYSEQKGI